MTSEWKVHVTALAIMAGVGIGAPAAAWIASDRSAPRAAHETLVAGIPVDLEHAIGARAPARVADDSITLPEVTVELPDAAQLVGHVSKPQRSAPEKRCIWHQSELLASGRVKVCDEARSQADTKRRSLDPTARRRPLAGRDLPSPTGLIRRD